MPLWKDISVTYVQFAMQAAAKETVGGADAGFPRANYI